MRRMKILTLLVSVALGCNRDDGSTFGFGGNPVPFDTAYYIDDSDDGSSGSADTSGGVDTNGGSGSGKNETGDTGEFTIVGTGYSTGDTAYNLQGVDQNGYPWSLHEQYGSPVVLILGHMYENDSFHRMMEYLGSISGAQSVAMVGYTADLNIAGQTDAASYASEYGVGTVMTDASLSNINTWTSYSPPKLFLIDSEMVISWTNSGFTAQSQLQSKIDSL